MSDERTRNIRFPLLPDAEDATFEVFPHPDGRPWLKACSVCACRTDDPQRLGDRYRDEVMRGKTDTLFYCLHRAAEAIDGDEFHRVCASYACLHPEQQEPTP